MATPGIDLVVRSVNRTFVLNGVDPNASIDDLKGLLHKRGAEENLSLPAQKQRLVHRGSVLSGGSLQQAGVRSGDHLVLLVNRGGGAAPSVPDDTTPVPTAATIRAAILAEARRRGVESSIVEEQPRPARHMYGGPGGVQLPMDALGMDVNNQLMQLLAALGGPMPVAPGGGGGGGGGGGAGHAQVGMPPQFGMLPPGMRLFGVPPPHAAASGAHAPGGGAPAHAPPQPAQPPPPPPPPVIPEPDAQAMAQLGEMGFGEPVVRKALLLHRNDMEQALNWLLQHGDDPAAAEPLTDDQLRQIYAGGLRGPASEPEQVEQLVAMGFDRNRAAAAMRRYRNMDVALAILLQQEEAAQGQQAQGEQAQQGGQQAAGQQEGRAVAPVQAQQVAQPAQEAQASAGAASVQPPAVAAGGPEAAAQGGGHAHAHDGEGHEHEHDGDDEEEDDDEDEDEEDYDEDDEDMTGDGEDEMNLMHMGLLQPGAGARGPAAGGAGGAGAPGAAPVDDGGLGAGLAMGGFGSPPFLIGGGGGGGMYGLGGGGGSAPAVTITRGPDGNDLVLGSAGASMPPLMPAHGIMLGAGGPAGLGLMGGGGGGGGGGLHMLAGMAPLLGGGGGGGGGRGGDGAGAGGAGGGGPEEEELLQGMGLVHQLLSAVLRDALNGQGGAGGGGPEGGPARR